MSIMPNTPVGEATVVASCWHSDGDENGIGRDIWAALVLHPETPFFQIVYVAELPLGGPDVLTRSERILRFGAAVSIYESWGGEM